MQSPHLARSALPAWLAVRSCPRLLFVIALLCAMLPASAPAQSLAPGTSIIVTTTVDEMNANGKCSLREAVDAAGSNIAVGACPAGSDGLDVIVLSAGTYTLSLVSQEDDENYNLTGDLDIYTSMRIEGVGAAQTIIDGGGIDRIFDISYGDTGPIPDVTISGVTLRNGANPVPEWSLDMLTNSAWSSVYSGGAIRNAGRLVIEDSVITGNHAQINGGAILSVTSLKLINIQVTDNLVRLDSTSSLLLSTIDLVAATRGGAIVAQNLISITDSAIDDNIGGGIFNVVGTATIRGSTISRNQTSTGNGAGIYNLGGTLELTTSEIIGNTSVGGGAGIVGISTSGTDYVYSSAITVSESQIADNQAGGSGSGILLLESTDPRGVATNTMTITQSLITGNQAGIDGGGIALSDPAALLLLEDSTVRGNSALANSEGYGYGGIANGGIATIRNSTISENSATTTRGHGGGIGNNGILTMIGGAVRDNQSTYAGGIYNTPSGTVTVTSVAITGNTAKFTGGGVRNDGTFSITGGTVSANSVTGDSAMDTDDDMARGGGIFNVGTLTADSAQLTGNTAYLGGGLANTACTVEDATLGKVRMPGQASLRNSTLSENIATLWGGAITNEGALSLEGATLSANQTFSDHDLTGVDVNGQPITIAAAEAGLGGAIVNGIEKRFFGRGMPQWCVTSTPLPTVSATINDSTISQNSAAQGAGGVANYMTLTISTTHILGNRAGNFAGGLHNAGMITIDKSRIAENQASAGFAGGLHNDETLRISASTVISNTAGTDGGGFVNGHASADLPAYLRLSVTNDPALLDVTDSIISANRAGQSGGGMFSLGSGSSITVSASTLAGNYAAQSGGAVDTNADLTLSNTTLSSNTAGVQGGGLNVRASGIVSVSFVTIAANQLVDGATVGAQIANQGQTRLRSTILAHTGTAVACSGSALTSLGFNLFSHSCAGSATNDWLGVAPLLGPLAANGGPTFTHALLPGSPAIDVGDSANCPATDQRGVARLVDGDANGSARCDIGAYEAPSGGSAAATVTPTARATVTASLSRTAIPTVRATVTASLSRTAIPTVRATVTASPTRTATPAMVPTPISKTYLPLIVR
ncbi:MAG: CSLREA domain-containing protein [Oscillochloris sp.]|nr:CSLREA domain-containing protein [Oscillochloris sp.]